MPNLQTRQSPVATPPGKIGLALTALGQFVGHGGGVSAANGVLSDFITRCVFGGFFISAAGLFITTLFTDVKTSDTPK